MNKIFEKNWAVGVISLIFALFIYTFVTNENNARNAAINSQLASSFNTSETLYNVPLYLGEHPDDIYVSDLKESVTVRLDGPKNILNQVTRENIMVQTEKISTGQIGNQELTLLIDGLPDEITYTISPTKVKVEVQQRKVVTVPVEVSLDDLQLESDFKVESVDIDPKEVKLVGSQKVINAIDFVGISIRSNQPVAESFAGNYRLQILDKDGKLLDVNSETMDIKAQINIVQNSKEFPLKITAIGEDNTKNNYRYSIIDQDKVILFGSQKILNQIKEVELVVDVSNQTESGQVVGLLNLPSGISSASINEAKVEVTIEPVKLNQ
ncbi:YbbR-like domain-containing protein [Facklamia sp. 7083-14-GEN3]|uniref:CdaR family protein n=1 Tax=Facklamia sp. 7083-14-GEN3 TaxID=2973478 RepID=UPI00215D5B26|nr:CdaR family protein [Facklamia sp. 7083-14-GEN3]MCR8969537.1 CdaR family protein [Facklamia sp. 7083-14-GEN3]